MDKIQSINVDIKTFIDYLMKDVDNKFKDIKEELKVQEKRLINIENLLQHKQKSILNIDEVCIFTGLSKSTIYKLTMSGGIPHYKQAKHLYFDRFEIELWLKENKGLDKDKAIKQAVNSLNIK